MEWYYVWWPRLTSKRVARVCQHQLSFLFHSSLLWHERYLWIINKYIHGSIGYNLLDLLLWESNVASRSSRVLVRNITLAKLWCKLWCTFLALLMVGTCVGYIPYASGIHATGLRQTSNLVLEYSSETGILLIRQWIKSKMEILYTIWWTLCRAMERHKVAVISHLLWKLVSHWWRNVIIIHAEHVVHRRGYCFHFGCMYVCMFVSMYVSALERKRLIGMTWNSEP